MTVMKGIRENDISLANSITRRMKWLDIYFLQGSILSREAPPKRIPNYFAILGITRKADEGIIKSSYRKLALEFHPDRNGKDDPQAAEEFFKTITEAYEILKDPVKRMAYIRILPHSAIHFPVTNIFLSEK